MRGGADVSFPASLRDVVDGCDAVGWVMDAEADMF